MENTSCGKLAIAEPGMQFPQSEQSVDWNEHHIWWVISASASVAIGHAALDAAIANYPDQRFTLRNGILVIRQHPRRERASDR
jgi:hypothetical protein